MKHKAIALFRRLACALCALGLAGVLCCPTAFAREPFDNKLCNLTLTLTYQKDDVVLSNVRFHMYQVATTSEFADFTYTPDFAQSGVTVTGLTTSQQWDAAANTLLSWADSHHLAEYASGTTDGAGNLTFTQKPCGLYLLMGEPKIVNGFVYNSEPFLVSLPGLNEDDTWNFDMHVYPKDGVEPLSTVTSVTVYKVWSDAGWENSRPQNVTVELRKNGAAYASATLNAANGWSFTWNNLPSGAAWSVMEKNVPAGYTVGYSTSGGALYVTNTHSTTATPKPGNPTTNLPQTGQLLWPVPVLAVLGLGCFALGWYRRWGGANR